MQPIKLVVLSFAPLTEAGIIEDAHARDGPCAHVNVHHETLKFAGLRAPRLSRRFAFLSFTIARQFEINYYFIIFRNILGLKS